MIGKIKVKPIFAKSISLQPFGHNKMLTFIIFCKNLKYPSVKITKLAVNAIKIT